MRDAGRSGRLATSGPTRHNPRGTESASEVDVAAGPGSQHQAHVLEQDTENTAPSVKPGQIPTTLTSYYAGDGDGMVNTVQQELRVNKS